jgi:hypothetical protein
MKNNQFVSKNSHFVVKSFFSNAQQINTRDIVTVCARSTTIIHHLCGVLKIMIVFNYKSVVFHDSLEIKLIC